MVDGSNESLYHPDKESDPILWKGIPLLKSLKIVDVPSEVFIYIPIWMALEGPTHLLHMFVCVSLKEQQILCCSKYGWAKLAIIFHFPDKKTCALTAKFMTLGKC